MPDGPWIVHDEKRMHLPELAGVCVTCLHEALQEMTDAAWGFMNDTDTWPHSLHQATHRAKKVLDTGSGRA